MSSATPAPVPAVGPHSSCPSCGTAIAVGDAYCTWCGALRAADAAGGVPPGTPRRPAGSRPNGWRFRGWRGRKGWVAAGLAAALLVVAALSYGAVRILDSADPGQTVRAYFQALAGRDAARAGAILALGTNPAAGVTVNTSKEDVQVASALHNTGYTPPSRVQVHVLRSEGASATVAAEFDLPGGHQDMQLHLTREAGAPSGWVIDNGAPHTSLPYLDGLNSISLSVLGVWVTGQRPALNHAFPGAYQVRLMPNPLEEATPVIVWAGANTAQRMVLRVRQGLQAEVQTQLRAYLDNCADVRAPHPTFCPFGPSIEVATADIQWRVAEYPTVNLTLVDSSWVRVLMTRAGGRAVATGHLAAPGHTAFTRAVTFQIGGEIFVNNGEAKYFPSP
jgi:hypothetical protein